ncbi:unknown [Roseburia sp. CAG:182]|nr:unknown [Roseburia sp. CAG:182]
MEKISFTSGFFFLEIQTKNGTITTLKVCSTVAVPELEFSMADRYAY